MFVFPLGCLQIAVLDQYFGTSVEYPAMGMARNCWLVVLLSEMNDVETVRCWRHARND